MSFYPMSLIARFNRAPPAPLPAFATGYVPICASSDTTGALPAPPSDAQIAAHVEGEVPLGKVPEATSTNGSASSHAVEPLRQTCLVSCDKSVSKPTSKVQGYKRACQDGGAV